eukprot:12227803-Alexandrium_andersonii.AAC.1
MAKARGMVFRIRSAATVLLRSPVGRQTIGKACANQQRCLTNRACFRPVLLISKRVDDGVPVCSRNAPVLGAQGMRHDCEALD